MPVGKEDFEAGVNGNFHSQILTTLPDNFSALSEREIEVILKQSGHQPRELQYTKDALDKLQELGYIERKEIQGELKYRKVSRVGPKEADRWFTVDEAAEYLRVSRRTVYQLIEEGEMASYRLGKAGHKRFKREDLDRVMYKEDAPEFYTMNTFGDPVLAELWENDKDAAYDQI